MSLPQKNDEEITPVDDTRRVRERIEREANGDIKIIAAQANAAFEKYRDILNLKLVPAPKPSAESAAK